MNKPLTIEELKALKLYDWVWVIDLDNKKDTYWIKYEDWLFNPMNENFKDFRSQYYCDSYGENWIAYKNKEQAENT